MTNHVSSWSQVQLGKILTYVDPLVELDDEIEYTTITVKRRHGGLEAREKLLGSQIRTKKQYKLVPGAFIISRVQCWHQAYAIVPDIIEPNIIASINYDQFVISDEVDKRFFWWLSYSPIFTEIVRSCAFGVVIEKMVFNRNAWLNKTISFPSLEEQQRIVVRIEELAAKIEKARGVRREAATEAERLFDATVSNLFSTESEQGWTIGRLEDYIIDDCYGTSEKTTDDKSGTPILRMGNIQDGQLDLRDLKYLHLSNKERGKLLLIRGDIVVNRTNSAELVGKCAVFDVEGDYGFASYLIRLRLDVNKADPRLVSIYMNSPVGRAYMFNERTQMTGQANVNAKKLKSLPIALPALPEQERIVAYLDNLQSRLDTLKRIHVKSSTELDAMIPSILDKAFKGEL